MTQITSIPLLRPVSSDGRGSPHIADMQRCTHPTYRITCALFRRPMGFNHLSFGSSPSHRARGTHQFRRQKENAKKAISPCTSQPSQSPTLTGRLRRTVAQCVTSMAEFTTSSIAFCTVFPAGNGKKHCDFLPTRGCLMATGGNDNMD